MCIPTVFNNFRPNKTNEILFTKRQTFLNPSGPSPASLLFPDRNTVIIVYGWENKRGFYFVFLIKT